MSFCRSLAILGVIGLVTNSAHAATVIITPNKDNTLFQDLEGDVSNGAGTSLYIGRAGISGGNTVRRPVVAFSLAAIPAGAVIESVTLRVTQTSVAPNAPNFPITLHRLTADWGEGASNSLDPGGLGAVALAGDATWVNRFYATSDWTTPGGDFSATSSASRIFTSATGNYTWDTTPDLVADVQGWINNPSSNFGWLMLGDESTTGVARKFNSREATSDVTRPTLTVNYSVPEPGIIGVLSAAGMIALARRRRIAT